MTYPTYRQDPGRRWKSALIAIAGGLAVTAAAAGASAAQSDVPTAVVKYSTASLSTDAGARALYHHLAKVAEQVCENQQPSGSRLPGEAELKCRQQAVAGAVEKIHNQRLVAVSTSSMKSG